MKRVLVVGAGKGGTALLTLLSGTEMMEIVAVVDTEASAPGMRLAEEKKIPTGTDWKDYINEDIDIVIEATGSEVVFEELLQARSKKTVVIPGSVAYITSELLEEKNELLSELKQQTQKQELILSAIHDGMIVIDRTETVTFMNRSAERILGTTRKEAVNKPIQEIIPTSRLSHILRVRRKEVNQKLELENGRKIITTRIPIIGSNQEVLGAFAVFNDITEVVDLAEEVTDLKEVKTMLEAIIQSSEEAISVVDENGMGIMINPAYTRITGLTEKEIVGKPATADISEGESMHMRVLQTRRAVRGVRMSVGPANKEVLVNVAPVIVDGKLKGSVGVLHDVSEIQSLTTELRKARQIIRSLEAKYTFDDIIGDSPEMTLALEQAKVGAKTPATVLLRGESGTGKELFAHAIHNESNRRHNKFIRVNCAAIAESILESELFGYEEGAFSGAKRGGKRGYFEEANHGSIFLDEIGELSLPMQAKLLRVLQENEIVRVGGTKPVSIDVRVIAATNVKMEKAIMDKSFREDLFYRLNRLPIFIPPLRERKVDISSLVHHLIHKINQDYGRNVNEISREALRYLENYNWPGNVRELENIVGRAMIYMSMNEEEVQLSHLPELFEHPKYPSLKSVPSEEWEGQTLQSSLEEYERKVIEDAFRSCEGNKTKTAKVLGISIRNLYYKLDKFGIDKSSMQDFS
ncbi:MULTISPECIES: sigma 54-interacting transcriptional regulator [Pontibacillus]|uniref:Sigma 54-interacting transcriptional regulator n=1 Tax=Pontibacillus chungwhensis TaxID=265426 RepID=A0ABY8UTW8_9BACI|nr:MULTISPECIES: sigma 54-interacting transcriptional regulator [Pontibacillus]MCD5323498.1 sigma 54-interacting transcriptional regulator [Pontibacillus sp. HN14]WIF96873.1 sigma 54-interacting transcriptional regulator [Pontibacillus chungwhensis]